MEIKRTRLRISQSENENELKMGEELNLWDGKLNELLGEKSGQMENERDRQIDRETKKEQIDRAKNEIGGANM